MTEINTRKPRITRKKNQLLRIGLIQNRKTNYKEKISKKCDPSATVLLESQPLKKQFERHHISDSEKPSFILQDDTMLIPMKNVNEENFGLLVSTLNRQGKRWKMTSLKGKKYFKIIM